MSDARALLARYLRQREELGESELFLDGLEAGGARAAVAAAFRGAAAAPAATGSTPAEASALSGAVGTRSAAPPASEAQARLVALGREAAGCTRCRLAEGRTQVVFGDGTAAAEVVVVGEAPGAEEDRQGVPFVGPAGKLLDLLMLSVGLPREKVYICNVLKCRPPGNRDPQGDEVEACAGYLRSQLDIIAPRAVLAVGKFAAQWLTGTAKSIGRMRGEVHAWHGVPLVVTYHPAFLLRSPHFTRTTWDDFQLLRRVVDEA